MGAGVSAGESNDELIDNLIEADFIKTSLVERVFRAVDRGEYILPDPHVNPYRDVAWKNWNFHISAPCIYSEVMEGLKLEPGLSFLNLGSGSGYLNTMVGLILGHNGINHGIELHEDVIEYANKKLEEFKLYSGAIDEYDFCEPKFVQGNCLCLASGTNLYDRVYCGAACPDEYLDFIRNFVKIGGILIVPFNERLVEIKRTAEENWNLRSLLPVSFANLVTPVHGCEEEVHLLDIEPLSLQELCRATIRNLLRKVVEAEHPSIVNRTVLHKPMKKKKVVKRDGTSHRNRNGTSSLVISRSSRDRDESYDYFLFSVTNVQLQSSGNSLENDLETSESDSTSTHENETLSNATEQTKATVEHETTNSSEDEGEKNDSEEEKLKVMHGVFVDILSKFGTSKNSEPSTSKRNEETGIVQATDTDFKTKINELRNKRKKLYNDFSSFIENDTNNEDDGSPVSSNSPKLNEVRENTSRETGSSPDVEIETESSDNDENDDEDDEDINENNAKKNRYKAGKYANSKFRKVDPNANGDEINQCESSTNGIKVYKSPYSEHMKSKIKELPLPIILKKYLHFHREL